MAGGDAVLGGVAGMPGLAVVEGFEAGGFIGIGVLLFSTRRPMIV